MRRGPEYMMPIHHEYNYTLPVPLELVEDFTGASYVKWIDNGDGTFTLKVFDLVVD